MSLLRRIRARFGGTPPRPRVVMRVPRAVAPAVWPALLVAVALVGLAVVGVRDLLVSQQWLPGDPWIGSLVQAADGFDLTTIPWWIPAVAVAVGLLLVALALRPSRRTHRPARDGLDLWLTPDALAAMAASTADRVQGVVSAEATPRRGGRRVVVRIQVRGERGDVRDRVRARLDELGVDGLVPSSRITVKAQEVGR